MIDSCETKEELKALSVKGQKIFQQMEDSKKPIVAAIMGSCLGGGLEVRTIQQLHILEKAIGFQVS